MFLPCFCKSLVEKAMYRERGERRKIQEIKRLGHTKIIDPRQLGGARRERLPLDPLVRIKSADAFVTLTRSLQQYNPTQPSDKILN